MARRLVPFGVSKILYHGRGEKPEVAASISADYAQKTDFGGVTFIPDFDAFLGECDFVVVRVYCVAVCVIKYCDYFPDLSLG